MCGICMLRRWSALINGALQTEMSREAQANRPAARDREAGSAREAERRAARGVSDREAGSAREARHPAGRERAAARRQHGRLLAGAPISWGVCEVPGWGRQLEPERVLAEMASLGLTATELGPVGYLPLDASRIGALLDRFELRLVAGFVPLTLHTPSLDSVGAQLDQVAPLLAAHGADVLTVAPVMDEDWSPPE